MRRLLLLMLILLILARSEGAGAQDALPPELILLSKIKIKVAENFLHLPNYTCLQTIDRSMRNSGKKFQPVDTVKLEVAMVDRHELYGWPGSNRINESDLGTLVGGTIGNGAFGLLVGAVFLSSTTQFRYAGVEMHDGKEIHRFTYSVPLLGSGHRLRAGGNEAIVGFHGTFLVETNTLDLWRLDMAADEIPQILGIAATTTKLEYQRTRIGSADFLLPKFAELSLIDFGGLEQRNQTRFLNCRQYAGEAILSFADPVPDTPPVARAETKPLALPDNFEIELTLLTPIDSSKAAVGDPVQARLGANLKDGRQVIAPKGAIVSGRILKMQREGHTYRLALSLQALDFEDRHADLTGRDNEVSMVVIDRSMGSRSLRGASSMGESSKSNQPIIVETDHLRLYKGFLLYLHSRLLKSE